VDRENAGESVPGLVRSSILIIDDDIDTAAYLARVLAKHGFINVATCNDAQEAITLYMESAPDLVVVDLHIPGFSGIEIMRTIRKLDPEGEYVPVIMMTGDLGPTAKRQALEAGCNDFIDKFAEDFEVMLRIKNALRTRMLHVGMRNQNSQLEQQVYERTRELIASQEEVVQRLAAAAEYRDDITGRHVERVGNLAAEIASVLGLGRREVEMIRRGAKLHDIGKIGIPDAILYKEGPLTLEERRVMQRHTVIGDQILMNGNAEIIRTAQAIARSHHERWDGTGYPDGLVGVEIPLVGRIVALADVFDAIITKRPYKEAMPYDAARSIILNESGRHFDPYIVDAFKSIPEPRLLDLAGLSEQAAG
jgi:putative two-component system response regulator